MSSTLMQSEYPQHAQATLEALHALMLVEDYLTKFAGTYSAKTLALRVQELSAQYESPSPKTSSTRSYRSPSTSGPVRSIPVLLSSSSMLAIAKQRGSSFSDGTKARSEESSLSYAA